jgi:signal transduction histidine kinase
MTKLIYKKNVKTVLVLLQFLAAVILAYCILNIGFWTEGSYSISEMSKNYEESELFFRQVDAVLGTKIRASQNQALFETDGEYDNQKQIDIQTYGAQTSSVRDMNTTYLITDLIRFVENGGQERLHNAIEDALKQQSSTGQEAGELLDEQSAQLETITPVTGITLSECSRWYSDPAQFVLEKYTCLDEVSSSIYESYQEYTTVQDESWLAQAPSNLRYCIENTSSGELYTNLQAETYEDAAARIQQDGEFVYLYEGERSFSIMMTNSEHVLNHAAEEWFMADRFVSTNEKVFLAVNTEYPVNDSLRTYAEVFARRESVVSGSLIGALVAAIVLIAAFALSVIGSGWQEGSHMPKRERLDRIPTELAAAIYMVLVVLICIFFGRTPAPADLYGRDRAVVSLVVGFSHLVVLSAILSFVRRVRTRTLWSNSITMMLLRTWRQVTSARTASGQFLILYIIFVILNFLFLRAGQVGIFLTLVMDLGVLLYFLRDTTGKQSIYEGIHQISKGDLTYKIDTSTLQGETGELAKAVNEMGDGLQQAVDAIVRNERLKAELITNVSHDIKTPLTSIVNYVDLLKRENLQDERVRGYIEVLDRKSQRLRQLTEDLVEASKITTGNIELHLMKLSLQSMLQQACGEFQERLEEKQLMVVSQLEKEPIFIMADGRQLWRVLENLLGNIYKYAMEGTRVYLELYREDRTAWLILQNTSRETLPEDASELAGRFVRGDKSRRTEGSGLGLSIAQSLVELHGGTFALIAEGDQFRVTVTFPVENDD